VGKRDEKTDLAGDEEEVAEQGSVLLLRARQLRDGLARDHEHVDGRLRVDVVEDDALVVLVDKLHGDLLRRGR
jgi:hypothetical protein